MTRRQHRLEVLEAVAREVPTTEVARADLDDVDRPGQRAGAYRSGERRRAKPDGGLTQAAFGANGRKVAGDDSSAAADLLHGRFLLLSQGPQHVPSDAENL